MRVSYAHSFRIALAAAAFLAAPAILPAAAISTLFNTGVDAGGALLAGGDGVTDPHYAIIIGPGIGGAHDAVTYRNPFYFFNGPSSRWISSRADGTALAASFVFRTTFDLTGFDPAQTTISVSCATDDFLVGVRLNGGELTGECEGFGAFRPAFELNSGFVAGLNSLEFTVFNGGGLMAFRAQYSSNTELLDPGTGQVPEPATFAVTAGGLAALVLGMRRKR